ncbi:MAG TPA: hypothetical protein DGH68_06630 [Bacteroidetes bacterium]|nr:hypothetical protein [Bacteroidota bacterium]
MVENCTTTAIGQYLWFVVDDSVGRKGLRPGTRKADPNLSNLNMNNKTKNRRYAKPPLFRTLAQAIAEPSPNFAGGSPLIVGPSDCLDTWPKRGSISCQRGPAFRDFRLDVSTKSVTFALEF